MANKYQRWDLNKRICFLSSVSSYTSSQASCLICLGCSSKLPETEWIKQQTYFFQFWKLWSPKLRHQHIWSLMKILFLVCRQPSPCILTWWTHTQRSKISPVSFYKGTNPFIWSLPSWPNYLPKASYPNTITLGNAVLAYEFWGDTNMKYIMLVKGLSWIFHIRAQLGKVWI